MKKDITYNSLAIAERLKRLEDEELYFEAGLVSYRNGYKENACKYWQRKFQKSDEFAVLCAKLATSSKIPCKNRNEMRFFAACFKKLQTFETGSGSLVRIKMKSNVSIY